MGAREPRSTAQYFDGERADVKAPRSFIERVVFPAAALLLSAACAAGAVRRFTVRDAWLAEVLRDKLAKAVTDAQYEKLAEQTEQAILARLRCGQVDKLQALTEMVFVLRGARYLPLAERAAGQDEKISGKKFAKWLLEHKGVSRLLFRAMGDVRNEDQALARLGELIHAEEKRVLAYPQLAVAFATSVPHSRTPKRLQATTLSSFRYYSGSRRFRYNVKTMPYEISRYLADTRLSIAERKWVLRNYHKNPNPARAFFDLRYDSDHLNKGTPKKISTLPYVLPNLRKVGGVCDDQAYYAAEVCKALGVPAAYVGGRGAGGAGHAWVAYLKSPGKRAVWDSSTGRYRAHLYYVGRLRDPATGGRIKDCELMLTALAAQLPLKQREQADALTAMACLVDRALRDSRQVDLSVINKLAETYDGTLVTGSKPKANTKWVQAVRKIDISLVEKLLAAVFKKNLVHTRAWELLVDMCESGRFSTKQVVRFMDVLVRRTAATHPDYSYDLVMRIVPTIKDSGLRKKLYNRVLAVYSRRPDLQGRVLIAVGDDYRDQGKKNSAMKAYDMAARRCSNLAAVVVLAARRAEDLYVEAGKTDLAIKMYAGLLSRAKKTKTAFTAQTAHYQLGMRLAELLEQSGKPAAARRIRAQIGARQ